MRPIDHIVVAVHDLDRAAEIYGRLGFQVGARNRHPWGTENRLIQFRSSFIELITVGAAGQIPPHRPRQFSFGAFLRDFLARREGLAMLVLSSADAASDAARFAAQGIGDFEPFFFERKSQRPDGSEAKVAFTLAFACDPAAPEVAFFVCQQHLPKNFWNRSFQQHQNGAMNLTAVMLTAPRPQEHAGFLAQFSGAESEPLPGGGLRFASEEGRIEVEPGVATTPRLTSCTVRVNALDPVARRLTGEGIPFRDSGERLAVASATLFGVELRFEER